MSDTIKYKGYSIEWHEQFECWAIYDSNHNKVREPYWGTTYEAEAAIDSGEAL